MGFAVVAAEVRSLSQRCAQAARDAAALIGDSIGKRVRTAGSEHARGIRQIGAASAERSAAAGNELSSHRPSRASRFGSRAW